MSISQPKDVEIKAGNLRVKISWAQNFAAKWNGRFERAQKTVSYTHLDVYKRQW